MGRGIRARLTRYFGQPGRFAPTSHELTHAGAEGHRTPRQRGLQSTPFGAVRLISFRGRHFPATKGAHMKPMTWLLPSFILAASVAVPAQAAGPARYGERLQGFDYPWPVQEYSFRSQGQALEMAYMDVAPSGAATAAAWCCCTARTFARPPGKAPSACFRKPVIACSRWTRSASASRASRGEKVSGTSFAMFLTLFSLLKVDLSCGRRLAGLHIDEMLFNHRLHGACGKAKRGR